MLAAALRDGTAHRRTTFEVFARRLPEGRRYGVVAGHRRASWKRWRSSGSTTPLWHRSTDFLDARHAGVPRRLPVQRRRRRLRRGRAVLPRLARAVGARHVRRMRGAGDAGAVDLQPRHRDRLGRRTHGQRRRGAPADRDGLAAHPRAGRRRRRARRLHRRIRRRRPISRPSAATACPRWAPARTRSRCCTPRPTGPTSGPRSGAGRRAGRRHHAARRHLRHHARASPTPSRWQAPSSARSASTPATWACWPARSAHNSTASAPPRHRIVVSGDLDEFAIAALRAEPVDIYGVGHLGGHRLGRPDRQHGLQAGRGGRHPGREAQQPQGIPRRPQAGAAAGQAVGHHHRGGRPSRRPSRRRPSRRRAPDGRPGPRRANRSATSTSRGPRPREATGCTACRGTA